MWTSWRSLHHTLCVFLTLKNSVNWTTIANNNHGKGQWTFLLGYINLTYPYKLPLLSNNFLSKLRFMFQSHSDITLYPQNNVCFYRTLTMIKVLPHCQVVCDILFIKVCQHWAKGKRERQKIRCLSLLLFLLGLAFANKIEP